MIRFSSISFFCCASSNIDKLFRQLFTLISSKMIGQDTFVKDFELSFLLLKESDIVGKKNYGRHSLWKKLNEHYVNGHSILGCAK